MSMNLMVLAMKAKVGNPLRKLVLIKLADNANDKGECWPSFKHIADQCEISKRSVITHIKKLEEMGFLKIQHRDGKFHRNSSNMYHLNISAGDALVQEIHHPSAGDSLPPSAGDAPRTSHSLEPVNESKDVKNKKPIIKSRQIPKNWQPNEKHIETCINNRLDVNETAEHFRDHHTAKGSTMKDWDAAFRTWLRNAVKFNKPTINNHAIHHDDTSWGQSMAQPYIPNKQKVLGHE